MDSYATRLKDTFHKAGGARHKAFQGLGTEQIEWMFDRIQRLTTADEMTAYLQGVVDGRDIERPKHGPLAFLESVRPKETS